MKQKRNVYTSIIEDDNEILGDDAHTNERYYEAFNVDTDISEVLAYASAARPFNGKPDNFLPRNEWNKLTPSQKEVLIAKRRSEREHGRDGFSQQPTKPRLQVNMHDVDTFVNLDALIDYIVCHHAINQLL